MATIIRFPAEALAWRAQDRARDRTLSGSAGEVRGEILIFTGVRYARQEDDLGRNNGNRPGRGRRRAKV